MQYKELFSADRGIFGDIFNAQFPDEYVQIFQGTIPKSLDLYAVMTYGEKTLSNAITPENYRDIVTVVIQMQLDGWLKQATTMTAEYNALNPITGKHEVTETTVTSETNNDESINEQKVFNDEQFNADKRATADRTAERTETKSFMDITNGIGNSEDVSTIIQKEMNLRVINWRKSIIFELIKEITTEIYN